MPVTLQGHEVPSMEEFNALEARVTAVEQRVTAVEERVTALEDATTTPPPDGGSGGEPPPDGGGGEPPPDGGGGGGTPGEGMTATITAQATPYHGAGPFVYAEADAEDMGDYTDPAGRFTVTCKRAKHADCDIAVDFMRYSGSNKSAAAVVLQRGTVDASNLNSLNQVKRGTKFGPYSVSVTGDYEISAETSEHYDGSEWRLRSWGAAGEWPFPLTEIAELQAQHLVGRYDEELSQFCPRGTPNMRYEPMQQTNGLNPTPGYVCALRMGGGSTGVDSAIGLEGDEISAWLGGQYDMLGSWLEQAEAYHIYPWHRIDPATGANIKTCGYGDLFKQGQIFNSGQRAIAPHVYSQTQAVFTGRAGTVIPSGTQVIDANGSTWNMLNNPGSGGIPSAGNWTGNIQATNCPYLPGKPEATLSPAVSGISVTISLDAPNTAEGADGMSTDINHSPNGALLPFLLTGDPYHLKSAQARASWHRAASPWTIGTTGEEWCTKQNFAMISARHQAWFLRDIAEATLATPDDVPRWLQPKQNFADTLAQIKAAYTYRWDHPANPGTTALNLMDTAGNQTAASTYYNDYLALACVRALVADPTWTSWFDRFSHNMTDRFDPASGWCLGIMTWYAGLDVRQAGSWEACFETLMASPNYTNKQGNGRPGLTGCPPEPVVEQAGCNWNAVPNLVWLYAAMTRLKHIGYGGDGFLTAYDAFVPMFKAEIMSGTFGATPMGRKFSFAP